MEYVGCCEKRWKKRARLLQSSSSFFFFFPLPFFLSFFVITESHCKKSSDEEPKQDGRDSTNGPSSARAFHECYQKIESVGVVSVRYFICCLNPSALFVYNRVSTRHPVPQSKLESRSFPLLPIVFQWHDDKTYDDFGYGQDWESHSEQQGAMKHVCWWYEQRVVVNFSWCTNHNQILFIFVCV